MCRLCVESYDPVADSYLRSPFRPDVFLMAESAREQLRLRLGGLELHPLSPDLLVSLCCSSLKYRDDVADIAAGCHPGEVIYKAVSFGF